MIHNILEALIVGEVIESNYTQQFEIYERNLYIPTFISCTRRLHVDVYNNVRSFIRFETRGQEIRYTKRERERWWSFSFSDRDDLSDRDTHDLLQTKLARIRFRRLRDYRFRIRRDRNIMSYIIYWPISIIEYNRHTIYLYIYIYSQAGKRRVHW